MQLKKLEMCGFKSFANRTEIVFDKGVTGVVGPNGCGKSNVVDAIKWVLGTQSYKSVRGEEMLDVIFKGASGTGAMGFAEVSLTLDNSDHTLPVEFEEVTITRKLFSSGEGEYFINKAPCRLKDIRELLYGTGIGTDNYSVIEQGKIDKLVLSNPTERRLVFDEAAGVSKYRARKRETELRLEKVSGDLLRIQDVVGEVQKQLRSVRAQAGRAARYKELSEEFRGKKLSLAVLEYRAMAARTAELDARLKDAEARRQELKGRLAEREAAVEAARGRLEEESARHAELASALATLESESAYVDRTIAASEARCAELAAELERLEQDRAALQVQAAELDAQAAGEAARLAELDEEIRVRALAQEEGVRRLEEAARDCDRAASEHEARKAEAVELAHQEAQFRNERARLGREKEEHEARAAAARARAGKLSGELSEIRGRIEAARSSRGALETEIAGLMARKRAEDAEQQRLRADKTRLERDLASLREGRDLRVARRETLRDLEAHLEGVEGGAKVLLQERPEGVLGTVADFLEVAPESVAAVEGALGDRAGAVVTDTAEHARAALALIRERGLSRTTVIALDECRNGWFSNVELLAPGVLGRAASLVRCAPELQGLVDLLLGHTLVVKDFEAASGIRGEGLTEWPLVTPAGDLLEHPGVFTAGGARSSQGLISRKAELRRLEEEIGEVQASLSEREGQRAESERLLSESDQRLEQLRHDVYDRNVELGEAAAAIEQYAVREQFVSSELESLGAEAERLEYEASSAAARGLACESVLAHAAWVRVQAAGEIAALAEEVGRLGRVREEAQAATTQARVEAVRASERRQGSERRIEMLETSRRELEGRADRLSAQIGETEGRREAASLDRARHEEERAVLAQRLGGARSAVEDASRLREALAADCETARSEKSALESELGPCEEDLNRCRIEGESLRVKGETLVQRAREELDLDLAAAAAEPAAEGAPSDPETLGREVDDLRAKLSGFGAVNVVALDQLSELEEREKYLAVQVEDLAKSKGQLEDLIRQLNLESRDLFDKTFEFVRDQFNGIFRKIFGGGKADIILENAEGVDPLERGIDIIAKPPGKEASSISLLSGGERSLTAIALVMSLFKANPSPFCLLDEADAALDEKNVERYAGVVKEFASDTQFIVITHNKRTMAVCDALYGVTMEVQGISKKVSVNLSGDSGLDLLKGKGGLPAAPEPVPAGAPA
jgi:chromosome segregation protein